MKVYHLMLIVFGFGFVGGVINALMSGNFSLLPKRDAGPPAPVIHPGLLVTAVIGGVAAFVSWGLYGGESTLTLLESASLTVSTGAGAVLVGLGGARWLTNEVDKKLLRNSVSVAAERQESPAVAAQVLAARPTDILSLVRGMKSPGKDPGQ